MSDTLDIKANLEYLLKSYAPQGLPIEWFAEQAPQSASSNTVELNSEEIPEADSATVLAEYEALRAKAFECRDCSLCEARKSVVFDAGFVERPSIAFVGEGPGADEDRLGEPFVGKAGALLTAALTKGMGLSREAVYICNVVKCRPPQNRTPLPDEVAACRSYLEQQLLLVKPKVIVTLGAPAMKALTEETRGITKARGTWHEWNGIRLLPTLHPAYILRNPAAKKDFWADLKTVMRELGM